MGIQYEYNANTMRIQCEYNANAMRIRCEYDANTMQTWCKYNANTMQILKWLFASVLAWSTIKSPSHKRYLTPRISEAWLFVQYSWSTCSTYSCKHLVCYTSSANQLCIHSVYLYTLYIFVYSLYIIYIYIICVHSVYMYTAPDAVKTLHEKCWQLFSGWCCLLVEIWATVLRGSVRGWMGMDDQWQAGLPLVH